MDERLKPIVTDEMVEAALAANVGWLGPVETFIWFDKGARVRLAGIEGTEEQADRVILRAALEAAWSRRPAESRVKVKAFRWEKQTPDGTLWTTGHTVGGEYRVQFDGKEWVAAVGMLVVAREPSSDKAKAAAYAHLNDRILSSLGPGPAESSEAVKDALLQAHNLIANTAFEAENLDWAKSVGERINAALSSLEPHIEREPAQVAHDGLDCPCGGGWAAGHASGCPEEKDIGTRIATAVMRWAAPHLKHIVSFNTLREAVETELAALSQPAEREGWRTMESAPKDKLIDIWLAGGVRWADCYYDSICDEWRTSRPSGQLMCVKASFVTHWMPLPTPPPDGTAKGERK